MNFWFYRKFDWKLRPVFSLVGVLLRRRFLGKFSTALIPSHLIHSWRLHFQSTTGSLLSTLYDVIACAIGYKERIMSGWVESWMDLMKIKHTKIFKSSSYSPIQLLRRHSLSSESQITHNTFPRETRKGGTVRKSFAIYFAVDDVGDEDDAKENIGNRIGFYYAFFPAIDRKTNKGSRVWVLFAQGSRKS